MSVDFETVPMFVWLTIGPFLSATRPSLTENELIKETTAKWQEQARQPPKPNSVNVFSSRQRLELNGLKTQIVTPKQ